MGNYTGKNIVFIVGCPRSGTTWLQKLLASHPKVRTGEESHLFSQYVGPQLRFWKMNNTHRHDAGVKHVVGPSAYLRDQEFLAVLRDFFDALLRPMVGKLEADEIFVEKTPSHALYIPEIKQLLPDSRVINMLRDPRAVVASLLAAARTWGADWAPNDPSIAAAMWIQHVQAVRESVSLLLRSDFHEIRYESLWRSPRDVLIDVSKFIGLGWSEQSICDAIANNQAGGNGSTGTPIPVYGEIAKRVGRVATLPTDFVRKAQPDSWRADLSFAEKRTVWKIVHKTMEDIGYSWRLRDWL